MHTENPDASANILGKLLPVILNDERDLSVDMTTDTTALANRIHTCLLGGAIGDALGGDIEFASLSLGYPAAPCLRCRPSQHQGVAGAITDDTQMTMFTAEGLIQAQAAVRWHQRGICLVSNSRLHVRRAPDTTCISALRAATGFGELARNNSKGCGTIMRVAPLAFVDPSRIRNMALETSALTHGHPTAQEAAAAWALILAEIIRGVGIEEAAAGQISAFDGETRTAILRSLEAQRDGAAETIESLGGGWIA